MKPPREPRLVIFDLDGTLVDSIPTIVNGVAYALAGIHIHPRPEEIRAQVGKPLDQIFQNVMPIPFPPLADQLVAAYKHYYHAHSLQESHVYPGIPELLRALGPHRTAVATTKPTGAATWLLQGLGILPLLGHVQGTDGFPPKPEPHVLLHTLEHCGVPPEDAVSVPSPHLRAHETPEHLACRRLLAKKKENKTQTQQTTPTTMRA